MKGKFQHWLGHSPQIRAFLAAPFAAMTISISLKEFFQITLSIEKEKQKKGDGKLLRLKVKIRNGHI